MSSRIASRQLEAGSRKQGKLKQQNDNRQNVGIGTPSTGFFSSAAGIGGDARFLY